MTDQACSTYLIEDHGEENEDFDEVLEHIWTRHEPIQHLHATVYTEVQWRKLVRVMGGIGLLKIQNGKEVLTSEGERRASAVIRRHRLAECLFRTDEAGHGLEAQDATPRTSYAGGTPA